VSFPSAATRTDDLGRFFLADYFVHKFGTPLERNGWVTEEAHSIVKYGWREYPELRNFERAVILPAGDRR
jgi:hypothetical protein